MSFILGSKKAIVDLTSLKQSLQQELQHLKRQNGGQEPTIVLSVDRRVNYGPLFRIFIAQECCSRLRSGLPAL